jgi:hypothetical protein
VPRDGRIILTFDLPWLWIYEKYKLQFEKLSVLTQQEIREKVEQKVKNLKEHGEAMRKFGFFCIFDSDPLKPENGPAIYLLDYSTAWMYRGEPSGTPEELVDKGYFCHNTPLYCDYKIASWRRVMYVGFRVIER